MFTYRSIFPNTYLLKPYYDSGTSSERGGELKKKDTMNCETNKLEDGQGDVGTQGSIGESIRGSNGYDGWRQAECSRQRDSVHVNLEKGSLENDIFVEYTKSGCLEPPV